MLFEKARTGDFENPHDDEDPTEDANQHCDRTEGIPDHNHSGDDQKNAVNVARNWAYIDILPMTAKLHHIIDPVNQQDDPENKWNQVYPQRLL